MSTNSNIILQTPDGSYKSIYCHWDGYLSHNGRILLENYTTYEKVDELIELGNLSVLKETAAECVSYHRWRGEDKDIEVGPDLKSHRQESYCYLFKNGEWYYTQNERFRKLTEKAVK